MSEFRARFSAELDTARVEQQIRNLENRHINLDLDTNDAERRIRQLEHELQQAEQRTRTFANTLRGTVIAARAFDAIRSAARNATESIKDFDDAITDLRMATGESYNHVRELVKEYNNLGKSLGAITTEVTDSADAWLRQGHSIADTNTLIRDSMILSKVAELDSADATEYLTSAMKGYKVAVGDVIGIVDKLTAIDLVSATDAGGLAEAMSRTAVTAKQAGVSMDQLLAYLAVTGEVTQKSMTSIGEAFKTIFTRMADIKAGKLQFIDEDGTVESLSEVETVLDNLGIKLRDSNNEFRNSFAVLSDVAAVWDELGSVQQAALTKGLGGTRQAEIVRVLMQNYDLVKKYSDVAATSAGTAEKKFGAYLDSMEAKAKSLQAALESLAFNTISTESIGGIVEATTALVNFIDKTNILKGALAGGAIAGSIRLFGLLRTAIMSAAQQMSNFDAAMALLRAGDIGNEQIARLVDLTDGLAESQMRAVVSSAALTNEQRIAILTAHGMTQAEAQATLTAMGLATAQNGAAAATVTFSGALRGLWATLRANPLILVASAITTAVSVYSSLKQKAEEAQRAALEAGEAAKEEARNVRELYGTYGKAKNAYDANAGSKEDLTSATDALLDSLGIEKSEIDELTEKYGNLDAAIQAVTVKALRDQYTEVLKGYEAARTALLKIAADDNPLLQSPSVLNVRNITKEDRVYSEILENAGFDGRYIYPSGGYDWNMDFGDTSTIEGVIATYERMLDARRVLVESINSDDDAEALGASAVFRGLNAKIDALKDFYETYKSFVPELNNIGADIVVAESLATNGTPQTQEAFDEFRQNLIDSARDSGLFVGMDDDISAAIDDALSGIPSLSEFIGEALEIEDTTIEVPKITFPQLIADTDSKNDYIDRLNSIREQAEYLQETLGKIRDGELSEGEKIDLFTAHPSLANAEDLEAGVVGLIDGLKGASATAEAEASGIMAVFDEMYAQIDPEDTEGIASLDALKNAYLSLFSTVEENTPVFKNLSDAISGVGDASDLIATVQEEMAESGQISLATLEKMAKEFGSNIGDYFTIGEDGKITADIEKIKTYYVDAIKEMELEDKNLEQSLIDALSNGFDESKFNFDALTSAMSKAQEVASIAAGAQKDIAYDTVESLREIFGQDFENYIITDEAGNYIRANTEALREYARGLIEAGNASDATLAEFDAMWQSTLDGTKEAETALDRVSKALSNVGDVSSYLTLLESDDLTFVEALEQAVKLLESMGDGYSLDDFFTFSDNGDITYHTEFLTTWLDTYLDKVVEAGDISEDFADQMKAALDVEMEEEAFEDVVDEYVSKVETLKETLETLRSDGKLSDSALYDLVKDFPELATETDNLEQAITNLIGTMNTDIVAEFEKQFGKVDSAEDVAELQAFMDIVLKLGEVVGTTQFAIDINAEADGMQNLFDAIKASVSSTGLAAESIENLKNRYQDLAGFDAAKLFERTANGIHLNTKELRELEKAYESQKKQKIDTTLDDLIAQYEDLTEQIDEAGTSASTVDLYAQRNDILSQINDTANLKSQYDALTSSFYKWEQAQSIGEEGDMYDSLTGGLEDIKQLYKDGLIGTNKFRSAVQLMTDQDLSNASAGELVEIYEDAYPKMERYFKENSNGVNNFLHDVSKINAEWASMNENGQWEVNIDDFTAVAEELGISAEAVGVIMRKLSDYGFDVDLDMQFADLDTIQTKAEKAASTLKEMGKTSYEFDFNATNIDRVNEQIKVAETTLDQFRNTDGTVNLDLAGAEEAQYVLATLILQKQSLDEASILKIDTGNVDGEIGEVLRQLQTLKTNYNNLELQTAIGADTTQIQTDIDTAIASLSNEHPEILTTLGIDATSQETMLAGINALSPEMIVQAGVDPTLVDEYAAAEHTSTGEVVWSNDKSAVESYASITKRSSGKVRWGNDTDSVKTHFYAKGTIRWTNDAVVNGTAHAYGTAFKNGDWGTKDSGVALGGELGQELVVRDGKFFTIGDNSAEFFKYKKGDVIFNAAQTAEIFSKGKITNATPRGKAYAGGSYGGNATGSLIVNGSVVTSPSGSSSSSGSKKSSGSSSSSSSDDSKIVDWIETAIDRIERAIKKLATTATSAYRTLKKRLGATADEISLVEKELALQEKAHARYLKEANSVSLSSALREKVHDGTIDISEYSGETAELIEEYQQWYEKALACSDAMDELHESLASLYEEKFNAISTEMDNELSLIEHKLNTFTTGIDGLETKGYLGGTAFYEGMQKAEQESMDILKERYDDLVQAMSDGMNSGEIEKYSESWYAMQAEINEAKEQIQEATLATIEYGNSIRDIEWGHFDYLQERISKVTEESERLIDLLSNSDLYGDRGQLSDAGMATLGLRGMNYNTYLAQAERYAEELAEIETDLAKDSNNTALIERREELLDLQQESILAAESEKQAIVDLVEEGINLELDSLKELIDAYTESLDSAKDLYAFQKKISDQTAEVASLQKQLAAYAGDTSEENRARIQKLQVDLSDAMEELEESQYDQYINDQKKLLDNFYDDYEATLNKRLDNVDALISDMIDTINVNADDIAATIENAALIAGMSLSDSMASIWNADGTQAVIAKYGDGFTEQLTTLNNFLSGIDQNLASLVRAGDAVADETIANTSTVTETLPALEKPTASTESTTTQTTQTEQTQTQESKKQVKITSGTWHIRAGAGTRYDVIGYAHKGDTFEYLGQSGNWNAVSYKGKKRWIYNSGSKIEGFSKGGWVEGLHEIARKQGDDIVTVNTLKRGEAVLSQPHAEIFKNFTDNGLYVIHDTMKTATDFARIAQKPAISSETFSSQFSGDINISFPIDHVDDYNDLMDKIKNDHKFEKFIQSMTVDRLVGKRALEKHSIKWR